MVAGGPRSRLEVPDEPAIASRMATAVMVTCALDAIDLGLTAALSVAKLLKAGFFF